MSEEAKPVVMDMSKTMPFGFDRPPDAINEKGVKWWLDKVTTAYARREEVDGTVLLPNIRVFLVQEPSGHMERLVILDDVPIFSHQSVEAITCRIDAMKMLSRTGP